MDATLDLPSGWVERLPGRSFHYSANFVYVANFPIEQFCGGSACRGTDAGAYPPGGVIVTMGAVGNSSRGPNIPVAPVPTTMLGTRSATVRTYPDGSCLGVGADHSLSYFVNDAPLKQGFFLDFCWRGDGTDTIEHQVQRSASSLQLVDDPSATFPRPS